MRDPKRIDIILNMIKKLWHKYPDQRFFQLLYNNTRQSVVRDRFFLDDNELEMDLVKSLEKEHKK